MRRFLALLAALLVLGVGASHASAHNHLLNPSGFVNQSGDGLSPGNSGETGANPGGNQVGNAKAFSRGNAEVVLLP